MKSPVLYVAVYVALENRMENQWEKSSPDGERRIY